MEWLGYLTTQGVAAGFTPATVNELLTINPLNISRILNGGRQDGTRYGCELNSALDYDEDVEYSDQSDLVIYGK